MTEASRSSVVIIVSSSFLPSPITNGMIDMILCVPYCLSHRWRMQCNDRKPTGGFFSSLLVANSDEEEEDCYFA